MKSILLAKPTLPSLVLITWNHQNRFLSTKDLDRGSQVGKGFFIAHLIVHAALGDINRGWRSRATESTESPQCRPHSGELMGSWKGHLDVHSGARKG